MTPQAAAAAAAVSIGPLQWTEMRRRSENSIGTDSIV